MFAPNPHAEKKEIMSVEDIRLVVGPIARRFGVEAVYLFGSVARGDCSEDSDYDFSIDEGKLNSYFEMLDFIDALAYSLGRDVDVVTRSDLGDRTFIDRMNRDEIKIYGSEEDLPCILARHLCKKAVGMKNLSLGSDICEFCPDTSIE